jgi:ElaB/YqjD/DUF883 family membrane-anchored ribosome-binding protein
MSSYGQHTTSENKAKLRHFGEDAREGVHENLRERVEHVRDIVENVRDRAEVAFREKPYLVPLTAGAVGFGIGVLFGSKVTRLIVLTAVGTIISETFGPELRRMAGQIAGELQHRLSEGEQGLEGHRAAGEG